MFTAALLLLGSLTPGIPESPQWKTDYFAASEQGKEKGRPLALFFGSGKEGWNKLCSDGTLGRTTAQVLADNYVCVYLDATKPQGKRLAADFEIADGLGLV